MTLTATRKPVEVPFICPVCTAENAVNLIVLSRAGFTTCKGCSKRLRSADVARAMHSPRDANTKPLRSWALHR